MTLLGEILTGHYAAGSSYADQACAAAVEEFEKHAERAWDLVARVEMAMIRAGQVGIPYKDIDAFQEIHVRLKAAS